MPRPSGTTVRGNPAFLWRTDTFCVTHFAWQTDGRIGYSSKWICVENERLFCKSLHLLLSSFKQKKGSQIKKGWDLRIRNVTWQISWKIWVDRGCPALSKVVKLSQLWPRYKQVRVFFFFIIIVIMIMIMIMHIIMIIAMAIIIIVIMISLVAVWAEAGVSLLFISRYTPLTFPTTVIIVIIVVVIIIIISIIMISSTSYHLKQSTYIPNTILTISTYMAVGDYTILNS